MYEVVGRKKASESLPHPTLYRMKIFAPNTVVARSRFWYYISLMYKVKRQVGEIVSVREIFEKKPLQLKNFGIWLRYDSRSGTHNMYKEIRSTSLTEAIEKLYNEMAARHRARRHSVQIIRTAVIAAKDCKRPDTLQFINSKIKFQMLHRVPRASHRRYRTQFKASAPNTFF